MPFPRKICLLLLFLIGGQALVSAQEVFDSSWQLTIAGRTVRADDEGAFKIGNIVVPDFFGENGPGTPADFLSDDFFRLTGYKMEDGKITRYVWSKPFQIPNGVSHLIRQADMTFSDTPLPEVEFVRITAPRTRLSEVGQTIQLTTKAYFSDTTPERTDNPSEDVTPRSKYTVYRTTNPSIAMVDKDGLITARGFGKVIITAVNNMVSSSIEINIDRIPSTTVEGLVRQSDQTPVAGAMVEVDGITTTTDAVGRFVIPDVPMPTATLSVVITTASETINRTVEGVPEGISDVGIVLLGEVLADQIASITPANGSFVSTLAEARVVFNVPMSPVTFTAAGFNVLSAGVDGALDTADDVLLAGNILYDAPSQTAVWTPQNAMLPNLYRLSIGSPVALADGTALPVTSTSTFRIFNNADSDGDGLPDAFEIQLGYDPTLADTDGDGVNDGDEDFDSDGVSNAAEILILNTNPALADTNENGINDGDEDSDMDTVKDGAEILAGSNPFSVDTDGDGFWDAVEIEANTDPADASSRPLGIIVSIPRATVLRLGTTGDGAGIATYQSKPRITMTNLGSAADGSQGRAAIIATPRVNIEIQSP